MKGQDKGRDLWHFENRQHEIAFDTSEICMFLKLLSNDLGRSREFSVVVSSDEAVRRANRSFRNQPETTDVLSFPDIEGDYLGDILISAARAAQQASEYGHSLEAEIQTLALHGFLHLNGFDHEGDDGQMEEAEERLRKRYGLPSGVIARCSE